MTERSDVRSPASPAGEPGTPGGTSDRLDPRSRTVIVVLLVSAFVVILNETIMSVALPVLMADLHVSAAVGQWLTAALHAHHGRGHPDHGLSAPAASARGRVYGAAMSLFSAGTLLAALAPGFPVLLAGRVVQASGTAIMMPLLMTTVMTLVPPARRGVMMGNISIVIAVAPAIGPAVSGLVLSLLGWRCMFWLVLPIARVSLAVGAAPDHGRRGADGDALDVLSVVLSAFGFGGLVYGLSSFGAVATAGAVDDDVGGARRRRRRAGRVRRRQIVLQRDDRALLDLRTFKSRIFTAASVLMMLMMAVLLGAIVLLPIYMQNVQRLAPLTTGLLLMPGGLVMGLLGPVVGRLYDRFGARALLIPGTVLTSMSLWSATLLGCTARRPRSWCSTCC